MTPRASCPGEQLQSAAPLAVAALSLGRPSGLIAMVDAASGVFDGVGLTPRTPDGDWLAWAPAVLEMERPQETFTSRGLFVSDVGVLTVDPVPDYAAATTLARLAQCVGAPRVIAMCRDPDAHRAARTLRTFAGIAEQHGIRIALEPMPYTPVRDVRAAVEMVEIAGNRHLGILLDVFQHQRAGLGPEALTSEITEKLELVQLADGVAEAPPAELLRAEALTNRRYPGEGDFPLAAYLRRIPAGTPLSVEAPCARHASWPLRDRAAALARATRMLLASVESR